MPIEEIIMNGGKYTPLFFKRTKKEEKKIIRSILEGPLKEKKEQANVVKLVRKGEEISFQEVEFVQWGYELNCSDEEKRKRRISMGHWTHHYAYDNLEFNFGLIFKQPFDNITGKNENYIDSSLPTIHFKWAAKINDCLIELDYNSDILTLSLSAFGRPPHPVNIVSEYVERVKSTRTEEEKKMLEFAEFWQRKGLSEQRKYYGLKEFIDEYCFKYNKRLAYTIENSKQIML